MCVPGGVHFCTSPPQPLDAKMRIENFQNKEEFSEYSDRLSLTQKFPSEKNGREFDEWELVATVDVVVDIVNKYPIIGTCNRDAC